MTGASAIILSDAGAEESARKISRLLEFFGLERRLATVEELLTSRAGKTGGPVRILATAKSLLQLAGKLESQPEKVLEQVHSVFCFTEKGDDLAGLAAKLSGGAKVRALSASETGQPWTVSEKFNDLTGPFAGLPIPPAADDRAPVSVWEGPQRGAVAIISNPGGAAFLQLNFYGVPLFLSTSGVLDIDAPLPARDFDIRRHFLSAVPAVLYVKWAFAGLCWQPPETTACLIIDDPLLRPRYGHLNYERLLGLMERENFSTSIAFIPWNWNRSSGQTVRLFGENPARFSLSIHGCDHTAGEYGSRNRDRLAWKSRQATQRMGRHRQQTGLPHDPVMVFPQGVFSGAAMAALKHGDFIGAVNSEVISADPPERPVTIADYWDVAVMNYSDFPIFTRRYPWAGVENFAFDILLGKPCLVVIHHNDCHDGYACLTECIRRLNQLNARLRWTNLADVVRRSFRQRETAPGITEIEMYGSEVRVENLSNARKLFRFRKRESAAAAIKDVQAGGQPVKWSPAGNGIMFETELNPGEAKTVTISFTGMPVADAPDEGIYYEAKVRLRRYLCEVRDNFLMRKEFSR